LAKVNGRLFWRILRLVTGWTLLLLGVIGLFLPVLQGFLFIASGLVVLSTESQWARRVLDRLKSWRRRGRARDPDAPSPPAG